MIHCPEIMVNYKDRFCWYPILIYALIYSDIPGLKSSIYLDLCMYVFITLCFIVQKMSINFARKGTSKARILKIDKL